MDFRSRCRQFIADPNLFSLPGLQNPSLDRVDVFYKDVVEARMQIYDHSAEFFGSNGVKRYLGTNNPLYKQ